MKLKETLLKNWLGGGVGALLAVVLGLALRFVHFGQDVPVGQGLIHWSYDLPFQFRPNVNSDSVVIVYMDEQSHEELNQPLGAAWDRSLHVQLLELLQTEGAKLVVLDIFFSEPGVEAANQDLAKAMQASGKVVIGADYEQVGIAGVAAGWRVMYPIETLKNAAAGLGLVKFFADPDFGVRKDFTAAYEGAEFVPSLSWKAAELVKAEVTQDPRQRDQERWLNYYGPPGVIPSISYHLALRTNGFPQGFFRNKIVFVGEKPTPTGFAGEKKDEFRGPYTFWTGSFASGVEVHATSFLNLVRQDGLSRFHWSVELLVLVLCGLICGYGFAAVRPLPAAGLMAGSAVAVAVLACFLVWQFRLWFGWLIVAAVQVPVAFTWSVLFNSVKLYIEKKTLEQSLGFHLSPARVKQIQKRPELLRPGAERQEISILFSDIANFSKITGRMDPEDLFKLLNKYFQTSLECIHKTDGTVIKLIGDAIFAIWNAPFVQPDQQVRACEAALMLRDQLVQFDAEQQSLPLRTRVGLHTGAAYVGNVGSSSRFDYTAIGDNINLASRLEGLNKYLGTDLLATRDIQKIAEDHFVCRLAGHFRFKGIDRVVEVHELIAKKAAAEETRAWREAFTNALHYFQRKAFDAAEAGFRRTLELHPGDGPAQFYLERIAEHRLHPPPDDWAGEVEIKEK
ncbi:MAG: adenylate/guanylate cyclase domain-containing protein [Verrucomicrobiota bacterium]